MEIVANSGCLDLGFVPPVKERMGDAEAGIQFMLSSSIFNVNLGAPLVYIRVNLTQKHLGKHRVTRTHSFLHRRGKETALHL